jgi:hypothetical protein
MSFFFIFFCRPFRSSLGWCDTLWVDLSWLDLPHERGWRFGLYGAILRSDHSDFYLPFEQEVIDWIICNVLL